MVHRNQHKGVIRVSNVATPQEKPIQSMIPSRMDKMPWMKFHWMVVLGLGTAWILDGLEVQIVAAGGYAESLGMTSTQVGASATVYLIGQVVGALVFGRLTDTLGRKKLFVMTLAVYLVGSGLAGLSMNVWMFFIFRFIAGLGIGGEYSAINSAIDELIPGKYRGRVDLAVNGTYWGGALLGTFAGFFFLNHNWFSEGLGWRLAFWLGPVLGLIIIYMRRHIPESPRWMVTHGQAEAAEKIVADLEEDARREGKQLPELDESTAMWIKPREGLTPKQLGYVFFKLYPTRTLLGVTLMITQSLLFNALFFTSESVMKEFYFLESNVVTLYFIPFAVGNLLGPLILGPLFDTVGRRKMIGGCYTLAALILAICAFFFKAQMLSPIGLSAFLCASFFFASAGASAGYLTVSEIFPLECRGQAISYFFAVAQGFGSVGPLIFGALLQAGKDHRVTNLQNTTGAHPMIPDPGPLFWGYLGAAAVMAFGGIIAFIFGVDAEGKALEEIAPPLSSYDEEGNETLHLPV